MDDPRTTQALRELAEMYLSPQSPPSPGGGPVPASDPNPKPRQSESSTSGASGGAALGSAGSGPLRLTSDESDPLTAAPELLIAGHLPGPASLWINQYAQRLTDTHPVTAALHLTEDDLALDLFGEPAIPADELDQATLPEVINALAPHAHHWLLHLSHPTDPLAHAAAHQTRQWTLLSGCDEAAVVAGYRLLKQLLDGRPDDCPPPALGVMFLGCDESDAHAALQRLARTAREHLHLTPAMIGCQQQMHPVRRKRLGHYPLDDWGPDSAELLATITDLPIVPGAQPQPPVAPPAPQMQHADEPATSAASKPGQSELPGAPPRVLLSSYLSNLHPLQARSPRHSDIELAVDDSGRLHLLGRDDPAAAASGGDILAQLLAARLWAAEHLQLIALTAPDRQFDHAAAPAQHVFTERAKHFGPLAHAGTPDDPPFKLHLLLPITVGDHTTYTSVELN